MERKPSSWSAMFLIRVSDSIFSFSYGTISNWLFFLAILVCI
jgi:hypothetical protein